MSTQQIILTLTALYNISMALLMHTSNIKSAVIFKVIPFFLGIACLYAGWVLK